MNPIVSYGDESAEVLGLRLDSYNSNQTLVVRAALRWSDGEEDYAFVSVNLDHGQPINSAQLPKDEFFAKSYSEGERLFNALIACGWIETTGVVAQSGFVEVPSCKLTDKAIVL